MYIRKTIDIYEIHVNYDNSWEYECEESTYKQAKQTCKEYRENLCRPVKIVKKRVKTLI